MDEAQNAQDAATKPETDAYKDIRSTELWMGMIKDAEKAFSTYHSEADNIEKAYADLKQLASGSTEREMQLFWANMEVIRPSIYARPPMPVVAARFGERSDLNRHASEILQRSLSTSFDHEDIHETLKLVRDDLAICGRGVPWLRYQTDEDGGNERVVYDHIDRKCFGHEPARKWKEVGFVYRKEFLTKEQVRKRFFNARLSEMSFKANADDTSETYKGAEKACVYELWDKRRRVVVWLAEGPDQVLDIRPPIHDLHGFFPCPKPAYSTVQRNTLVPVPDYLYFYDQLEEINEYTARISSLAESLRLKGFYASGEEDLGAAIEALLKDQDHKAVLVPVQNFAAYGDKGIKDSIVWLPIREVAATITALVALRKEVIEDLYQVSGVSDIMRGNTEASETFGAQKLKSQFGSIRVQDRQEEMIRIARDCTRIAGEIMAETFDPQTFKDMAQYDDAPAQAEIEAQIAQIDQQLAQAKQDPQILQLAQENPAEAQNILGQVEAQKQQLAQTVTFDQVVDFLADQRLRPFILDIETDSTIQPDEDAAKQRTTEFLAVLTPAITQLSALVAEQPDAAEFAGDVLKFAVNPFRAGRAIEPALNDFIEKVKRSVSQPRPNPEQEKVKADLKMKSDELALRKADSDRQAEIKDRELRLKERELDLKEREEEFSRQERETDRQQARENEMVKAGFPPDYSYMTDREEILKVIANLAQTVQSISDNQGSIAQGLEAVAGSIDAIETRLNAPKTLIYGPNGNVAAIKSGDAVVSVRRVNGQIAGTA